MTHALLHVNGLASEFDGKKIKWDATYLKSVFVPCDHVSLFNDEDNGLYASIATQGGGEIILRLDMSFEAARQALCPCLCPDSIND